MGWGVAKLEVIENRPGAWSIQGKGVSQGEGGCSNKQTGGCSWPEHANDARSLLICEPRVSGNDVTRR